MDSILTRVGLIIVLFLRLSTVAEASFGYYRSITIDHTQCGSSDSTNFPVLINSTNTTLKTVGNGGHVQNANGYDIRPYSDNGAVTSLTFQLERYTATTGEVIMWVKVPTVSHTSDTVFYLFYGDATISTDGSSTSTWDSHFKYVTHLPNGTTLSAPDATAGGTTATLNNATAGTGEIDGGGSFDGGSHSMIDTTYAGTESDFTASAWYKATGNGAGNYDRVIDKNYKTGFVICRFSSTANAFTGYIEDPTVATPLSLTLTDNTWHFITLKRSGTTGTIYADGGAGSFSTTVPSTALDSSILKIGWSTVTDGYNTMNGLIDEVEYSDTARGNDWLITEYNNQKPSSTFYTLGSETPFSSAAVCTLTLLGVGC